MSQYIWNKERHVFIGTERIGLIRVQKKYMCI